MKNKKNYLSFLISHFSFPQKGFTLIELMVVLSVTAVLGTLGIAGFTSFNQTQILQTSANEVVTMLNLAKSRAQSQVKLGSLCDSNSTILKGYGVDISIASSSYTLTSHCSVGQSELTSAIQTKTLPQNLNFDANSSFFFPIQTGGVQVSGQIVISGYGREKTITVNSLGGISLLAGNLVPTSTPAPTSTPTLAPTATPTTAPAPTNTPTPTSTPTPTPIVVAKRVFLTSTTYNGNLGGLAGADAKCQTRANAAFLGGTWKAWLSDSTNSPAQSLPSRPFTHATGPYKLVNGTLVANDWNDLITNKSGNYLTNPINKDESGNNIPNNVVWTGTNVSGNPANSDNCLNWTSGSGSFISAPGKNWLISQAWTGSISTFCDDVLRLYCFEQ